MARKTSIRCLLHLRYSQPAAACNRNHGISVASKRNCSKTQKPYETNKQTVKIVNKCARKLLLYKRIRARQWARNIERTHTHTHIHRQQNNEQSRAKKEKKKMLYYNHYHNQNSNRTFLLIIISVARTSIFETEKIP